MNRNQQERSQLQHDQAIIELRRAVWRGRLRPGELVSEVQLSHEFSIGRTPIRQALNYLGGEGLFTSYPRVGTQVTFVKHHEELYKSVTLINTVQITTLGVIRTQLRDVRDIDEVINRLKLLSEQAESVDRRADFILGYQAFHLQLFEHAYRGVSHSPLARWLNQIWLYQLFTLDTKEMVAIVHELQAIVTALQTKSLDATRRTLNKHCLATVKRRFPWQVFGFQKAMSHIGQ